MAFEKAFPQYRRSSPSIDAPTPELADEATAALVGRLSQQKDLFRSIEEPQGGSFFAQNGLLFESAEQLAPQMKMLTQAQRLLQNLGVRSQPAAASSAALQFGLIGVQGGQITLDNMTWAMTLAADTLEQVNANGRRAFPGTSSSRATSRNPTSCGGSCAFSAVLDFTALEPGHQGERCHPPGRRPTSISRLPIRRACA